MVGEGRGGREVRGRFHVDDFRSAQGFGNFDGDGIRINAKSVTFSIEAERGDDRNDPFLEEEVDGVGIDFFDAAGVELVGATEDTGRVSDDGVEVSGAEIDRGKPFHDFVRQADSGIDRDLEGGFVGDASAVGIAKTDLSLFGELADLVTCAMD